MTRAALSQLPRDACQNPALLLQHYAGDLFSRPGEKRSAAAKELLKAVVAAVKDSNLADIYGIAFRIWKGNPSGDGPFAVELATAGRLRIGAGSDNALEFSLRLHPLYGVPIIPGSAIKGLAAHYCHQVWGAGEPRFKRDGEFHNLIFGATDEGGVIAFQDAWITPDSLAAGAIARDIMTPHHQTWQVEKTAPTDFDGPIPVPCLSVSGSFYFVISWNGLTTSGAEAENRRKWLALVGELIKDAVAHWGVGGKTSSGYGRMTEARDGGAAPDGASQGTGVEQRAAAFPAAAGKRRAGTPVQLVFRGPRVGDKKGFLAQEEGRPMGVLSLDEPPGALPAVGGVFEAYIKDDAKAPQYTWNRPKVKPAPKTQRPLNRR